MFPQTKSLKEINHMKKGGMVLAQALILMKNSCEVGMSTYELDKIGQNFIESNNMKCGFLGYHGFPTASCISINEEVVHGIPKKEKIIQNGDIVKIDIGVIHKDLNTDACISFIAGEANTQKTNFLKVVKESLFNGIKTIKHGSRLGDISNAIQTTIEKNKHAVVKDLTGHGIGKKLHEPPEILNFGKKNTGPTLRAGHTLAIEPIATMHGNGKIYTCEKDKWTIFSVNGSLGGQYEFTIAVTEKGCEILTPWHELWD